MEQEREILIDLIAERMQSATVRELDLIWRFVRRFIADQQEVSE